MIVFLGNFLDFEAWCALFSAGTKNLLSHFQQSKTWIIHVIISSLLLSVVLAARWKLWFAEHTIGLPSRILPMALVLKWRKIADVEDLLASQSLMRKQAV